MFCLGFQIFSICVKTKQKQSFTSIMSIVEVFSPVFISNPRIFFLDLPYLRKEKQKNKTKKSHTHNGNNSFCHSRKILRRRLNKETKKLTNLLFNCKEFVSDDNDSRKKKQDWSMANHLFICIINISWLTLSLLIRNSFFFILIMNRVSMIKETDECIFFLNTIQTIYSTIWHTRL